VTGRRRTLAFWRSPLFHTVGFGNLFGAVVTFSYLAFFDRPEHADRLGTVTHVLFFVAAYPVLAVTGFLLSQRWMVPHPDEQPDLSDPVLRRRVLAMPFMLAGVTALGWALAGLIWGLALPLATGTFDPARATRLLFGITIVGGSITTAFTFFTVEAVWRRLLPRYFPHGDLRAVAGVPRLGVRPRLVLVFLFVGLLPMSLMARRALRVAETVAGASPVEVVALLGNMIVVIGFLVAIGVLTAVGLAFVVSRSVSEPLHHVEAAMARVGAGDLTARAVVVGNDEIGAVAEGFNRMVAGLRERERIRETFGRYVSPEVRDEILAGRVSLAGDVREVTILFSDLRDFTAWVESHPPAEVVRDINEYFTLMEGAIRAHRGLVLQFIGDEIEAVFGAPIAEPHHADQALAAALEMRRRLAEWNDGRRAAGRVAIRHGIGIHTGEVLAAAIGSPERQSYALVGDSVNLASRIQDLTKDVGAEVLVSGATVRRLREPGALEPLPAVRVKGRAADVEVYRAA